jgi:hypothetical protein
MAGGARLLDQGKLLFSCDGMDMPQMLPPIPVRLSWSGVHMRRVVVPVSGAHHGVTQS